MSKKTDPESGLTLISYAPGDGAIAFTWCEGDTATAKRVTRQDCQWLRDDDDHLKTFWLMEIQGRQRFVVPVTRVNENTLELKGDHLPTDSVTKPRKVGLVALLNLLITPWQLNQISAG